MTGRVKRGSDGAACRSNIFESYAILFELFFLFEHRKLQIPILFYICTVFHVQKFFTCMDIFMHTYIYVGIYICPTYVLTGWVVSPVIPPPYFNNSTRLHDAFQFSQCNSKPSKIFTIPTLNLVKYIFFLISY